MKTHISFIREYLGEFAQAQADWEYLDLCLHLAGSANPAVAHELDQLRQHLEEGRLRTVSHHIEATDAMLELGIIDPPIRACLADLRGLLGKAADDLSSLDIVQVRALLQSPFAAMVDGHARAFEKLARDLFRPTGGAMASPESAVLRGVVAGPAIYGKGRAKDRKEPGDPAPRGGMAG